MSEASRKQTPSQTVGPYFAYGLTAQQYHYPLGQIADGAMAPETAAERIRITGRVFDGKGQIVPDALIEFWQADAAGRYGARAGFGRQGTGTDAEGRFVFDTIKPGAYPWGNHYNAWRPNHIHFSLFGASIAARLVTQMYFPGDPLLALDPIYLGVPEGARERLISRFSIDVTEPDFCLGYVFDIVLRGRNETPMER